jgi:hypothetical protein
MSRPNPGDWKPARGYRRVNQPEASTPIANLGADEGVKIGDLGSSPTQENRWDKVTTQSVSAVERTDTVGTFDSNRNVTIGNM